jgi:NAD-dependent dihydropyrimidine dehydrogenase PreA subunit
MNLAEIPMRIMRRLNVDRMWELEEALAARPDAVHARTDSPQRFEIVAEGMKRSNARPPFTAQAMPHMMGSMRGIRRSLESVSKNPAQAATQMSEASLGELEAFARSLGVADIGYARLGEELVFRNKAVLHENVIVLTMEMDKRRIDTSPSKASFVAVHETYHLLGVAANQMAGYLRKRGYSAQAGHPLMGLALYPPLAQQAGLGWRGLHGLLITPNFGPRVRLAAVFTSIENLPLAQKNDCQWIEEYCNLCKLCVRECPPQAILDPPIPTANGLVTCTVNDKCFPYFMDNYGCSICIRICPFQEQEFAVLKNHVSRRQNRAAG